MWNFEYGGILGIWSGAGEAEALGELVFDNLATLLGITGLMIGFFLKVKIYYNFLDYDADYAQSIVDNYEAYYCALRARATKLSTRAYMSLRARARAVQRAIPGTAFGLLFGNAAYAWQAGRLAKKENRTDVTAQPYGINTTGAYITLGAVNLTALFDQGVRRRVSLSLSPLRPAPTLPPTACPVLAPSSPTARPVSLPTGVLQPVPARSTHSSARLLMAIR